jgi:hypothetical protein
LPRQEGEFTRQGRDADFFLASALRAVGRSPVLETAETDG